MYLFLFLISVALIYIFWCLKTQRHKKKETREGFLAKGKQASTIEKSGRQKLTQHITRRDDDEEVFDLTYSPLWIEEKQESISYLIINNSNLGASNEILLGKLNHIACEIRAMSQSNSNLNGQISEVNGFITELKTYIITTYHDTGTHSNYIGQSSNDYLSLSNVQRNKEVIISAFKEKADEIEEMLTKDKLSDDHASYARKGDIDSLIGKFRQVKQIYLQFTASLESISNIDVTSPSNADIEGLYTQMSDVCENRTSNCRYLIGSGSNARLTLSNYGYSFDRDAWPDSNCIALNEGCYDDPTTFSCSSNVDTCYYYEANQFGTMTSSNFPMAVASNASNIYCVQTTPSNCRTSNQVQAQIDCLSNNYACYAISNENSNQRVYNTGLMNQVYDVSSESNGQAGSCTSNQCTHSLQTARAAVSNYCDSNDDDVCYAFNDDYSLTPIPPANVLDASGSTVVDESGSNLQFPEGQLAVYESRQDGGECWRRICNMDSNQHTDRSVLCSSNTDECFYYADGSTGSGTITSSNKPLSLSNDSNSCYSPCQFESALNACGAQSNECWTSTEGTLSSIWSSNELSSDDSNCSNVCDHNSQEEACSNDQLTCYTYSNTVSDSVSGIITSSNYPRGYTSNNSNCDNPCDSSSGLYESPSDACSAQSNECWTSSNGELSSSWSTNSLSGSNCSNVCEYNTQEEACTNEQKTCYTYTGDAGRRYGTISSSSNSWGYNSGESCVDPCDSSRGLYGSPSDACATKSNICYTLNDNTTVSSTYVVNTLDGTTSCVDSCTGYPTGQQVCNTLSNQCYSLDNGQLISEYRTYTYSDSDGKCVPPVSCSNSNDFDICSFPASNDPSLHWTTTSSNDTECDSTNIGTQKVRTFTQQATTPQSNDGNCQFYSETTTYTRTVGSNLDEYCNPYLVGSSFTASYNSAQNTITVTGTFSGSIYNVDTFITMQIEGYPLSSRSAALNFPIVFNNVPADNYVDKTLSLRLENLINGVSHVSNIISNITIVLDQESACTSQTDTCWLLSGSSLSSQSLSKTWNGSLCVTSCTSSYYPSASDACDTLTNTCYSISNNAVVSREESGVVSGSTCVAPSECVTDSNTFSNCGFPTLSDNDARWEETYTWSNLQCADGAANPTGMRKYTADIEFDGGNGTRCLAPTPITSNYVKWVTESNTASNCVRDFNVRLDSLRRLLSGDEGNYVIDNPNKNKTISTVPFVYGEATWTESTTDLFNSENYRYDLLIQFTDISISSALYDQNFFGESHNYDLDNFLIIVKNKLVSEVSAINEFNIHDKTIQVTLTVTSTVDTRKTASDSVTFLYKNEPPICNSNNSNHYTGEYLYLDISYMYTRTVDIDAYNACDSTIDRYRQWNPETCAPPEDSYYHAPNSNYYDSNYETCTRVSQTPACDSNNSNHYTHPPQYLYSSNGDVSPTYSNAYDTCASSIMRHRQWNTTICVSPFDSIRPVSGPFSGYAYDSNGLECFEVDAELLNDANPRNPELISPLFALNNSTTIDTITKVKIGGGNSQPLNADFTYQWIVYKKTIQETTFSRIKTLSNIESELGSSLTDSNIPITNFINEVDDTSSSQNNSTYKIEVSVAHTNDQSSSMTITTEFTYQYYILNINDVVDSINYENNKLRITFKNDYKGSNGYWKSYGGCVLVIYHTEIFIPGHKILNDFDLETNGNTFIDVPTTTPYEDIILVLKHKTSNYFDSMEREFCTSTSNYIQTGTTCIDTSSIQVYYYGLSKINKIEIKGLIQLLNNLALPDTYKLRFQIDISSTMEHNQVFNLSSITTDDLTIAYTGIFNYNDTTHNIYISVLDDQNGTVIENTSISDKKVSPTIPNERTLKAKIKFDYNNNLKIDTNNLIETWVFYSDTSLHYTSYDGNYIMKGNERISVTKDTAQINIPKNDLTSNSIYASTYLYLEFYLKTGITENYKVNKFSLSKLPVPYRNDVGQTCGSPGNSTDLHELVTTDTLVNYKVTSTQQSSHFFNSRSPICGGYYMTSYYIGKISGISNYAGYGPTELQINVRTHLFDETSDRTRTEYSEGHCPQRMGC